MACTCACARLPSYVLLVDEESTVGGDTPACGPSRRQLLSQTSLRIKNESAKVAAANLASKQVGATKPSNSEPMVAIQASESERVVAIGVRTDAQAARAANRALIRPQEPKHAAPARRSLVLSARLCPRPPQAPGAGVACAAPSTPSWRTPGASSPSSGRRSGGSGPRAECFYECFYEWRVHGSRASLRASPASAQRVGGSVGVTRWGASL